MRNEDYRRWRRESDERLRRAYELAEQGFAELDARRGRPPRPWREAVAEHLARVRAELTRPRAT